MDFNFSSLAILISFFLILITLFMYRSKTSINLPPGPRKLPFIGHWHLLASSRLPHHILRELAFKYGPMMHLQLGEISTIVISSAGAAKEVMTTHGINFANRPSLLASEIMCYNNTDIAFAPYGEYWRQLRKICTLELLSMKRVQSFRPIREEEFSNLCRWIASNEGSSINLTERISLANFDIIMRASIGKKATELTMLIDAIKKANDLVAGFYIVDMYPSIKLFQLLSRMRERVARMHTTMDGILENIINDHRLSISEDKQENLIDVLLKFNDAANEEIYLTTENIKAVLMNIFSGGIETSATTVDWAMAEMVKHPKVLKKAQDEVRRVFKDKGFVDEDDFDELKYLKLVVKEVLRLHPPLPLLLPRENREACQIHGYEIPAKTRVIVNAWMIGRDPKQWEEAESFIPERHIHKSVDYEGRNFEYIPFGAGRRICPGQSFGLANVEFPLAMLLYYFDWVLPEGIKPEDVDMTETLGTATRRTDSLYVIPIVKTLVPEC